MVLQEQRVLVELQEQMVRQEQVELREQMVQEEQVGLREQMEQVVLQV